MSGKPNLADRVAVVTGASRGLGNAIALALADANARVVLVARDGEAVVRAAEALSRETGSESMPVAVDVTSIDGVRQLKEQVEQRFASPEILINAAGVFGPLAPFSKTDPEEWIRTLMVNTVGAYLTCRTFVPAMLANGWGRIVNLSTASSLLPPQALDSAYSTSKTALNRLTRHLAVELEGTGVAATVIHPGSTKTDMWSEIESKAGELGEPAAAFLGWAARVEHTGGDPPVKAASLVLELVDPARAGRNGEFCWIEEGLESAYAELVTRLRGEAGRGLT